MGGRRNQVGHLSFLDVTMDVENFSKNTTHLTCVTASTRRGDVDDIEKDIIYAVSSNATSSCRLSKSVGYFLFGKANRALLLALKELRQFLQRSELFLHLRCRPCKRCLKNLITFKTLISESRRSLERVKRFIVKSLSTLRSLKSFKVTHDSVVARV